MKRHSPLTFILGICIGGLLAGCATATPTPTPELPTASDTAPPPTVTITSSLTATATATNTPLSAPTATVLRSRDDLPPGPTPSLPEDFDFREFLFADNPCQLPCWQGLVIGESTADDVQQVFDDTLGFDGAIDFFEPGAFLHRGGSLMVLGHIPEGLYLIGYSWTLPHDEGIFTVAAVLDRDDILVGLEFDTWNLRASRNPSLAPFMADLGVPDYWTLDWDPQGFVLGDANKDSDYMPWELLYKKGVYVQMLVRGPVMPLDPPDNLEFILTLCEQAESLSTKVFLTSPYSDIQEFAPNQMVPTGDLTRFMDDQIVEDTFGMSKDAVMAHFMASDDACLTTR